MVREFFLIYQGKTDKEKAKEKEKGKAKAMMKDKVPKALRAGGDGAKRKVCGYINVFRNGQNQNKRKN